eukprot:1879568-Prorocentrum_lima.AAC.1
MKRTTYTRWTSSAAPVQISSVPWGIEYPMCVWDTAMSCYITSSDEEELVTGEVEFYLPAVLAHWH